MLKKFILNSLSSFVGAWLAIVLLIAGAIIFFFGIIGKFASKEMATKVEKHSILKISLNGEIDENESTSRFDYSILMKGRIEATQTLKRLMESLKNAAQNDNIEALYIECSGVQAAPATLDALRNGIKEFKKSGKRVFAYGDNLSMGDYFVASVADAVYLNPAGNLDLQGINGTSLYFKEFLDKIGVEIQTVRVGTFKSAVEPFISNDMSEPARMQLDSLYDTMWTYIVKNIAGERKVKPATIDSLVNDFIFLDESSTAKAFNLVDDCLYQRQVMKEMADYVGKDIKDLNFVLPEQLISTTIENTNSDKQIAVVYAVGDIAEYADAGINCHILAPLIVSLADNEDVKGMVLRVNSTGGSVFGSEQIGEALDYFKSKGKPLSVSMGDYAASGGYWISAGADIIYADPLTITGSIGIFGMVPNVQNLVNRLGIHPQTVGTNPSVLFPSIFYPMNAAQQDALQKNVERGYDKFVARVAEGRHKSPQYIKSIAEGRVWSAQRALELGLVDKLGGLGDAIDWTAGKAGITRYDIVSYPIPEYNIWSALYSSSFIDTREVQMLMERLSTSELDQRIIEIIRWFLLQKHVQARSPYYKVSL